MLSELNSLEQAKNVNEEQLNGNVSPSSKRKLDEDMSINDAVETQPVLSKKFIPNDSHQITNNNDFIKITTNGAQNEIDEENDEEDDEEYDDEEDFETDDEEQEEEESLEKAPKKVEIEEEVLLDSDLEEEDEDLEDEELDDEEEVDEEDEIDDEEDVEEEDEGDTAPVNSSSSNDAKSKSLSESQASSSISSSNSEQLQQSEAIQSTEPAAATIQRASLVIEDIEQVTHQTCSREEQNSSEKSSQDREQSQGKILLII